MESLLLKWSLLNHWQTDLLVILLLLQGAFIAVLPEEIIITALGVRCFQGQHHFIEAVIAVQLGLLPANALAVFFGSRLGRLAQKGQALPAIQRLSPLLNLLNHYGAWVVVMTRFIPAVRGPVYIASGVAGMKISRFFRFDYLASWVQIPALILMGGILAKRSGSIMVAYQRLGIAMACLMAVSLLVALRMNRRPGVIHDRLQGGVVALVLDPTQNTR